ncbi:conserved hypothetical protein [Coccidioides posadasii str. Silveira]|uniref:Uncharacterized protein n=1 Tax=Coccidioides posadasii (strain RMSCC 757 / Silveira) TaxID=443226 RepID=E9D404_COCPS|nr:conserved hypothetical protein [Coccidioides posadasii str. Silveira]
MSETQSMPVPKKTACTFPWPQLHSMPKTQEALFGSNTNTIQEMLSLENWEARNDLYFYEVSRCMLDLCKDWKFILPDYSSGTNSVKSFTGSSHVLILRSQLHKGNGILNKIQPRKPKTIHIETLSGILDMVQLTSSMLSRESDSYLAQAVQASQEPENDDSDKKNWNSLQNIMENYFETAINWPVCSKRPAPAATGHKL